MRCLKLSPFLYSVLLLIFLALPGTVVEQQGTPAGWTPELSMKLKNVGPVRVSPDARKVAYTVSQAVMTPEGIQTSETIALRYHTYLHYSGSDLSQGSCNC